MSEVILNEETIDAGANAPVIQQPITPMILLEKAIAGGADMAQLEKLMDLQERYENREAEKAFNVSFAQFKANAPEITKDVDVKFNNTEYSHANLSTAAAKISEEMAKHGLSFTWETNQESTEITVKCKIIHELGHSQSVKLQSIADGSGAKNPIQAIGSAVSYLQRYTLFSACGIAAKDQDDDGVGSHQQNQPQTITTEQAFEIVEGAKKKGIELPIILRAYKVAQLDHIESIKYDHVMDMINKTASRV